MPPPDPVREAIASRVRARPDGITVALAKSVHTAGGDAVRGLLFFGSRKTQARPDPYSAYDLVVVVSGYPAFYRSLRAAGQMHRSAALVSALNAALPPNQVALRLPVPGLEEAVLVKCAVVSVSGLLGSTSAGRRDHFLMGRLFQPTEILHAADPAAEDALLSALTSAHRLTYSWVRPWLPASFDVADYCRTLLRVSFGGEIRPEPEGRAEALWVAQQDYLQPVYTAVLDDLLAHGELRREARGYALVQPVQQGERLRGRAYFGWSMVRATARWAKYVVTFEGWLDFIVRKARRHSGQDIVLTERERRLPLLFLWPRVLRYLRDKNQR